MGLGEQGRTDCRSVGRVKAWKVVKVQDDRRVDVAGSAKIEKGQGSSKKAELCSAQKKNMWAR